jgi:hypothetical protein
MHKSLQATICDNFQSRAAPFAGDGNTDIEKCRREACASWRLGIAPKFSETKARLCFPFGGSRGVHRSLRRVVKGWI